jgi:phosphatidylinositol phospholipase C, delta
VWNGEPPIPTTLQRPQLPSAVSSSYSLSSQAASAISTTVKEAKDKAKEKVKEKFGLGLHIIAEKTGHYRIPSINSEDGCYEDTEDPSAIDSSTMGEPLHKSSSSHGNRSRHNSNSNMKLEPRVLHGWTLTSEVPFRDVCKTIRETAFLTTNLPIIVSLEVHADLEQQETMVQIMKEEWKGLLIDEVYESCKPEERLPKLNELFNKVSLNSLSISSLEVLTWTFTHVL